MHVGLVAESNEYISLLARVIKQYRKVRRRKQLLHVGERAGITATLVFFRDVVPAFKNAGFDALQVISTDDVPTKMIATRKPASFALAAIRR